MQTSRLTCRDRPAPSRESTTVAGRKVARKPCLDPTKIWAQSVASFGRSSLNRIQVVCLRSTPSDITRYVTSQYSPGFVLRRTLISYGFATNMEFSHLALRLSEGSAFKNLTGALHTDRGGCMLSVGRKVKTVTAWGRLRYTNAKSDCGCWRAGNRQFHL